jgi:hypothetical protein
MANVEVVMSDALVKVLNSYGYQPVFLPHTGYVPPELYSFEQHKLIRHGTLTAYIKESITFQPTSGDLGSIEGKVTSSKNVDAAIGFLSKALAVIGLGAVPKVDLSFAGSNDFVFAFEGVTYQAVDPAVIESILQGLTLPLAIPDEYVAKGDLHIAYEYAYADTVKMGRTDGKKFSTDVSGNVGAYVDVGTKVKTEVNGNSTITFSGTDKNKKAAFAYKAGRLLKQGARWVFEPEVIKNLAGPPVRKWEFVPAYGVVLPAEDAQVAGRAASTN